MTLFTFDKLTVPFFDTLKGSRWGKSVHGTKYRISTRSRTVEPSAPQTLTLTSQAKNRAKSGSRTSLLHLHLDWKAKPSQEDEDDHAMSSGDYFRSYDELSVLGAGSFGRAIKCRARGGGGWVPKGHETFVVKEVRGRHSTKIRRDKKRSFIRRFFCGLFCALQIAILPVPAQSIFKGYSFFLLRSKAPTEATKRKPSC